jgi:hypothetical protein
LFGFLIVILLFTFPAWAATYYVDATSGNEYNDGLSPSTAWKTIEKAGLSNFKLGENIFSCQVRSGGRIQNLSVTPLTTTTCEDLTPIFCF